MKSSRAQHIGINKRGVRKPFVTIAIPTSNVKRLWAELRTTITRSKHLSGCSIVTSQGKNGWADYELLFHFDPKQRLDQESEAQQSLAPYFQPAKARSEKR
jgi:hypothetical protein